MMLPPVTDLLTASSGVTAIVGTNIYRHSNAKEGVAGPYITWFAVTTVPENNLSGLPPVDMVPVQVDCWHKTDAGIELLAKAVRDALEPHAHMTGVPIDTKETETKLYHRALVFDFWHDR